MLRSVLCALVLGTVGVAAAQVPPNPLFVVDWEHDSGWVANEGDAREVVISFPVVYDAVSSIRLHFADVELSGSLAHGDASVLRITSLLDGSIQTLDARTVSEWRETSAYFNGNALQVEVLAWPGTGPNRVAISQLEVGIPWAPPPTQCGPTDDRVPSDDPRVARLMPSGCTAWMIDDCAKCFLSAGHCGFNSSVQFNVPFSNPNGSLVFPGPEDQYSIDGSSFQSNNVFGNDWQYFGTFANSTTGLTAFEAQGAAFTLVSPPSPSGTTIRITGHGVDSTPNSTYNQIQQTSTGPMTGSGSSLSYQADTEGGNSGSPVIWEQMDMAIGVHTNGGCSTGGGGSNSGTPITVSALQSALAAPEGICASGGFGGAFTNLRNAKAEFPFQQGPELTACGSLEAGSDLTVTLIGDNMLGMTVTASLVIGLSNLSAPFKGGTMVPSPDIIITFPVDTSTSDPIFIELVETWPAGVASGSVFYVQYWVTFDSAVFDGLLASNAISMTAP